MNSKMINTYIYTKYERLWHWFQMILIGILLITGFEVNGLYTIFGFQKAVNIHNTTGITWLISFVFFIFWLFTTGEWKQYIPTTKKMFEVVKYYAFGIFKGSEHPVPKRKNAKHNPLQRLCYLLLAAVILPAQMTTGILYWTFNSWEVWGLNFLSLDVVALIHLISGFIILQFILIHVYMVTTGHSVFTHIRAMLTGWEEIQENEKAEEWERR